MSEVNETANPYAAVLAGMGEQNEMGASRLLLPVSYYPMKLTIDDLKAGEIREDGGGGNPAFRLGGVVIDGAFKDCEVVARLPLTFGKGGNYINYLASITKAITKTPVDWNVMSAAGFEVIAGDPEGTREAWADRYVDMTPEERLDFMAKYLRIPTWEGKIVIASIGQEVAEPNARGEVRTYNRWQGFYPVDDAKHGKAFWLKVCKPKQDAEFAAMNGGR